ncbi:MAG: BatA domain-containing protein [Nannocystaceae bacterium]
MSLLSPLLLLGLLGLGLPVVAHLLGRERPKPITLASRRFVTPRGEVLTHRRRLRDRALMAVRLVLLGLIVFALSRPSTLVANRMDLVGSPHDAVIVVDVSHSMMVESDKGTMLSLAADSVAALVDALPPGSQVGLVVSDPAVAPVALSADLQRPVRSLRSDLEDPNHAAIRHGSWSLVEALPRAAELFEADGRGRPRVIYAIGDRTARGLASLPQNGPEGIAVVPIAVEDALDLDAPPALPEHIGIEAVTWEPARDVDPRAVRIQGRVRRHAGVPAAPQPGVREVAEVAVVFEVDGTAVARTTVELAETGSEAFSFVHTLNATDGPLAAAVELEFANPDPLPGDDRFPLWIAAEQRVQVTVVNGDPSELRAHDEVFFLATAIHSVDAQHAFEIHGRAPEQVEQELREKGAKALSDTDVLILANVRALSEDVTPALVESVEAGMGLWITVGDRVQTEPYNERLGGLLPLLLREPVTAGTLPGRAAARSEGMAPANLAHPALQGVTSDLGIAGTRTRRLFLLEPDPQRAHEAMVNFGSGAPALLTRTAGLGRVALLATSIDRDWSDLPLRPGFVPLAERTIDYLAGGRRSAGRQQLHVGDVRVFGGDGPVSVATPDGSKVAVVPDENGVIRFDRTDVVGTYRVEASDAADVDVFAVVPDSGESVLTPAEVTAASLPEDGVRQEQVRRPQWRWFVLLAALALAIEAGMRRRAASQ